MAAWSFQVHSFLAPKAGLSDRECEDALGWNTRKQRFCVADGATEGFNSRRWARLLVKHWLRSTRPVTTPEAFVAWTQSVSSRFEKFWSSRRLSWYAEEKARDGAFAAFIGLSFHESSQGLHWQAIALGDSVLLLRRDDEIVEFIPIGDAASFNSRPTLLPSKGDTLETAAASIVCKSGRVESGDTYLLLSDAIAAWYLRSWRDNGRRCQARAFEEFVARNSDEELHVLLNAGRQSGLLRNDDVAAIVVCVGQDKDVSE
jgi:hypothetical protein